MHSILFIYRQMQSQALQVVEGLISELLQQRALPLNARPCCTMSDASLDYRLGAFSLGLAIEPSGILVRGIEVFCVSLEQSRDEIYRSLRAVLCDFVHSSVLKIMRSLFSDVCLSDFAPLSQVSRHAFLLSIGDQTGCYLLLDLSTLHQGVCDLSLLTATVAKSSGVTERVHKLLAIPLDDLFMPDGLTLEASILNRVDRLVCATQLEHEGFILFVEEERLCLVNAPVIFPAVECWLEFRDTLYQVSDEILPRIFTDAMS